jgi:hypothetical protein
MSERLEVNAHFLDRLVEAGQARGIEATEDIVCGNGVKLVAKGAAIDARMRERLLQHKLRKPLEACTRIVAGVSARPMDAMADRLMNEHALLASLCRPEQAATVMEGFRDLRLSTPLDTLLTVYADSGPGKLEHAVGVSLIAGALATTLHPEWPLGPVLVAGLVHDIGELYIDPAILGAQTRLTPEQWRHVVAHPVIAAGLLRELPGAGPAIAEAVLHHHERLDGLGFPAGIAGGHWSAHGQVLAMAEMMMEMLEAGPCAGIQARVRLKLMHTQFDRRLLDWVGRCCREVVRAPAQDPGQDLKPRIQALRERLSAQCEFQARWSVRSDDGRVQALMQRLEQRLLGVHQAFASTGLTDALDDGELTAQERAELDIIAAELDTRLSELAYELHWRASQLHTGEAAALRQDFEISVPMPLAA